MLPKQLKSIKDYLTSLKTLDDKQKQLLHELTFIDKNTTFEKTLDENYSYREKIFESFTVASDTCPTCGKKK